ncbi:uncharacterized protein LOC112327981 [Populus trichocarpa]|uniref:uncharacterized protein LOC112327981 n=1 Tax=Populus trichocarpa TaxID=3694 RepID=UPI000D188F72|nr:uncharacterized protein LOC112327981 [Populus trichocarpa]|eukprot:XP_024459508.1 uncharacterized protein LOC112327981 [Populus trichocarpa]
MIAKSKRGEDHVKVLKKLFERLRKYELKLNPAKCSFGVKSGKLLGFVVSEKGIEVDPDKAKAIQSMPSPKTENEVLLSENDIVYMTRKVVKGSAIADHLADNVVEDYEPLDFDLPDENVLSIEEEEEKTDWWTMFFDGAVNVYGNGAGTIIIYPDKKQYPVSVKLHFECTNNTTEYEASTLAVMAMIDLGHKVQHLHIDIRNNPTHCCSVEGEIDGNPWYYDIKNFMQNQEYPMGASKMDKKTLTRLAMDFYLDGEILYKRSFDGTLLRCLNEIDARNALREVHEGTCSTYANG